MLGNERMGLAPTTAYERSAGPAGFHGVGEKAMIGCSGERLTVWKSTVGPAGYRWQGWNIMSGATNIAPSTVRQKKKANFTETVDHDTASRDSYF